MTAAVEPRRRAASPEPPEPRRRLRRVLMLAGLVPLLATVALVSVVASMLLLNHQGRDDLAHGRYAAAEDAFGAVGFAGALEPWVAPYDEGIAVFEQGRYADARDRFEDALADVPEAQECRVRVNLALAHEALGDAALADADLAGAREGWSAGRAALAAGGCLDEPDRVGRTAGVVDERLEQKLAQVAAEPAVVPPPPEPAAQELEQRNQEAERVRRKHRQHQEDEDARPDQPPDQQPVYSW